MPELPSEPVLRYYRALGEEAFAHLMGWKKDFTFRWQHWYNGPPIPAYQGKPPNKEFQKKYNFKAAALPGSPHFYLEKF